MRNRKWTPEQKAKFKATMAAKRNGNGHQVQPIAAVGSDRRFIEDKPLDVMLDAAWKKLPREQRLELLLSIVGA